MHRLRYCWQEQNSEFNFTSTVWYQHAWIAILLTIRKVKLQLYEHNLISTCLDRDTVDCQKSETSTLRGYLDIDMHRLRYCWPVRNSEFNFTRMCCYQHASIAILLAARKVKVQFDLDNLMLGWAKWLSVVQRCTFTDVCKQVCYAKLMECCSKVDFPWKRLAAQSSEKWWRVV